MEHEWSSIKVNKIKYYAKNIIQFYFVSIKQTSKVHILPHSKIIISTAQIGRITVLLVVKSTF